MTRGEDRRVPMIGMTNIGWNRIALSLVTAANKSSAPKSLSHFITEQYRHIPQVFSC